MTREEMILELLGKCGQDFDEVMSALQRERLSPQKRETPRYETFAPRATLIKEKRFERSQQVDKVRDAEAKKKKEIADFTERQMAVGEAILRKMR